MRFRRAVWLFAVLTLWLAWGSAAAVVWEKQTVNGNIVNMANDVAAADMNGDGALDILASAGGSGEIILWRNLGGGRFDPAGNTVATLSGATSVFAADLNGGGGVDVLATGGSNLMWYENNNLSWSAHTIDSGLTGARDVLAINLDGDTDVDVVAIGSANLVWYRNNGAQFFLPLTITAFAGGAGVDVANLDGDADLDVIACGGTQLVWYENDGSQNFTPHPVVNSFGSVDAVRAADLDGDGHLDLVAVSDSTGRLSWWRNDGAQNFSEHLIDDYVSNADDVRAADLDGDGDLDLTVAADNDEPTIAWFENQGNGNFLRRVIHTGNSALGVAAADVTGDGVPDVLGAISGASQVAYFKRTLTQGWQPERIMRDSNTYTSMLINSNRLYLGQTFHARIDICDITDPAQPAVIGGYDELGGDEYNPARFLALYGNYLFVSNGEENLLQILNVSNPAAPTFVNQWYLNNDARGIVLAGAYGYVGDRSGNLYTFQVADPAALTLAAVADVGSHLSGMTKVGNYLYIADRGGYLTIVDVSSPTAVAMVSSCTMTAQAQAMEVDVVGNYAYVATTEEGLQVVDIGNPANPVVVGHFTPFGIGMDVAVQGDRLLLTTGSWWYAETTVGLYMLDISTPARPALLQAYTYVAESADNNNDALHQVMFNGDYVYAAIWGQGLGVFQWNVPPVTPEPTPTATPIGGLNKPIDGVLAFPNPAKGTVSFLFEESNPDKASIELYNLAGELVTKLEADQPGQTLTWTIQDVVPGLYLYRTVLTVNGEEKKLKIKKLAILK